ncbi:MAG: glycosyltransferase [Candidatus Omnitrophota bacterium]
MEKPFISIVIPVFNAGSTILQAIEACKSQDYPADRIEIIVVDDGSTDNTKEAAVRPDVKYIYQKKSGPASARNNGFKNAKGDAICFTDADCTPDTGWVSKLVNHYYAEDTGAVAGSYDVYGSPYLLDKFVHYEIRDRHSRMPEYVNSFGTYNVMIKRNAFEAAGGFNPEYCNASGEDTDLSYRIIRSGYKIYFAKNAFVSHKNILRLLEYFDVQFRHAYWRMKLYKAHCPMIAKDEYGYWKDFLEVFLAMGAVFCLFFNLEIASILAIALFLIQLSQAVKIAVQGKNILYAGFSFVTFIRVFVRIAGGAFGFIRFWIFRMG